jgi:hypothetical protein
MDAFESIVAAIVQRQGYWTATSVKVPLSKAEKRRIGRFSAPRWELDLVAHKPSANEVLIVECKSFIDSPGVRVATFQGARLEDQKRYKLFFEPTLRRVVLNRLSAQLVQAGLSRPNPRMTLCLAAGKIKGDPEALRKHFDRKGWRLFDPAYLRGELHGLRDEGYENSVAAVVAKLLLREPKKHPSTPPLEADV